MPSADRFDRGLITITSYYTVSVSDLISEDAHSPFGLKQFEGQKISLPVKKEWWPEI